MPHHSEETTPSKASLKAWWKQFTAKTAKRESEVKGKGKTSMIKKKSMKLGSVLHNVKTRLLLLE